MWRDNLNQSNPFTEYTNNIIADADRVRSKLELSKIYFFGPLGVMDPGRHLINYINMISNRIITLYDDCAILLQNNRIPPACVISRCILETYAVGYFAIFEVASDFNKGGVKKSSKTILNYINSSRLKSEEQRRLKENKFKAEDYHFTDAALRRMNNEEAASKHILNAMRHMFKREMKITSLKESRFELLYEQLSEWTHPSQTSLFHAFCMEAWSIETSIGQISLWDGARAACGSGMHCITAVPDLMERMKEIADQLSAAYRAETTG